MHTFRSVKVEEFKTTVIDACNLLCYFILEIIILVDVDRGPSSKLTEVQDSSYLTLAVGHCIRVESPAPDACELVGRFSGMAFIFKSLAAKSNDPGVVVKRRIDRILFHEDFLYITGGRNRLL